MSLIGALTDSIPVGRTILCMVKQRRSTDYRFDSSPQYQLSVRFKLPRFKPRLSSSLSCDHWY